jgi:hypothetical protein
MPGQLSVSGHSFQEAIRANLFEVQYAITGLGDGLRELPG